MTTTRRAEGLVLADRRQGVFVPCLVRDGRGGYPGELEMQSCARCTGTGEEPAGAARSLLVRPRLVSKV